MSIDQQPIVHPPVQPAKRSWFARHKVLTGIGAGFIAIAIGSAATGGTTPTAADKSSSSAKTNDSTKTNDSAKTDSKAKTDKPVVAADGGPSASFPMQDGDWRLDSLTVEDSLGSFGARARITYTGDDSGGGDNIFTVTIFKGGTDIGSLMGSASDVAPGRTKTVQMISSDDYVSGSLKYTFQNDL